MSYNQALDEVFSQETQKKLGVNLATTVANRNRLYGQFKSEVKAEMMKVVAAASSLEELIEAIEAKVDDYANIESKFESACKQDEALYYLEVVTAPAGEADVDISSLVGEVDGMIAAKVPLKFALKACAENHKLSKKVANKLADHYENTANKIVEAPKSEAAQ